MHARYGIASCCSGVISPGTLPVAASFISMLFVAAPVVRGTAELLSARAVETATKIIAVDRRRMVGFMADSRCRYRRERTGLSATGA
jgi:hypothetical protein